MSVSSSELAQASGSVQLESAASTCWNQSARQVSFSPTQAPLSPEPYNFISCASFSALQFPESCCQGTDLPAALSIVEYSSQMQPDVRQHIIGQHQAQAHPSSSTQQTGTQAQPHLCSSRPGKRPVRAPRAVTPTANGDSASASSAAMVRSLVLQ